MRINDLEHLSLVEQSGFIEGAAFAYASSSSIATKGFASSEFQTIASGKSFSITSVDAKVRAISVPQFSYSSSSTSASAYARD